MTLDDVSFEVREVYWKLLDNHSPLIEGSVGMQDFIYVHMKIHDQILEQMKKSGDIYKKIIDIFDKETYDEDFLSKTDLQLF